MHWLMSEDARLVFSEYKEQEKHNEFWTYIKWASAIVDTWPEWKRNCLGTLRKKKD